MDVCDLADFMPHFHFQEVVQLFVQVLPGVENDCPKILANSRARRPYNCPFMT